MTRIRTLMPLVAIVAASLASGCLGGDPTMAPGGADFGAGATVIPGVVVDEELAPVSDATVTTSAGDARATTDHRGAFVLGPLEDGEHVVRAAKDGYEPATATVQVIGASVDGIHLVLKATALDVPYHASQRHVTYVNCASYNPIGGVPCTKLVDYLAGTNLSGEERFAFTFFVPNPGLADVLVEMTWTAQALGKDMLFKIQTPPGQPATALSTNYYSIAGGSPLRGWVVANVANQDREAIFDAEPNKVLYEGLTIWDDGNSTVPGVPGVLSGTSLYLNHRTEVWLTMFYNRAGSRDFTALPDV